MFVTLCVCKQTCRQTHTCLCSLYHSWFLWRLWFQLALWGTRVSVKRSNYCVEQMLFVQQQSVHSLVMWPLELQQQLKPTSPKSQNSLSLRFYPCTLFFLVWLLVKQKHESPSITPLQRFGILNYACKMKKKCKVDAPHAKWSWSSGNQCVARSYNIELWCHLVT